MNERRLDPTTGESRVVGDADSGWDGGLGRSAEGCALCPTRPGHPPTRVPLSSFDVVVIPVAAEEAGAAVATAGAAVAGASAVEAASFEDAGGSSLYAADPGIGVEEVVVYSDDHDLDVAGMDVARIAAVVEVWADRYAELGGRDDVAYVLIFEDRGVAGGGAAAGGLPDGGLRAGHPHARVHAYPVVPPRPGAEIATALARLGRFGTCVFCDIVARELGDGVRLVARNASFLAFVPFAPRFPYEVHLISHRHAASLLDLTDPERVALAELLKRVLTAYDGLFGFPLPYAMAVHQAPTDDGQHQSVSHLHVELTPRHRGTGEVAPVGAAELGAGAFTTDLAPEVAATRLRDLVAAR